MPIIAIASQKGGCGKTTTAVNLAAALAYGKKRVLLIDLDPQSHATLGLNVQAQNSIYNTLSKLSPKKLPLDEIITNIEPGFDLAPSSILLVTIEQELADEIGREARLREEIEKMNRAYDYILIDCPPNLGLLTINAIRAADEIMIPVETSRFSLFGVERLIEIIDLVKERLNHPVEFRIVITMFDSRLRHSFEMLKTVKNLYAAKLLNTIIHINVKLKEAIIAGTPVLRYDKYSRGSKDYLALASELTHPDKTPTAIKAEKAPRGTVRSQATPDLTKTARDFIKTSFALSAPSANTVYVVGDFNNWSPTEDDRLIPHEGRWEKVFNLKKGKYRYKFIVDGTWEDDPQNAQKEQNSFGSFDSVLELK